MYLLFIAFGSIDPGVTVAIVAAAIGPIGAYLIAARRMSGKIANSDAEQLWEESRAIREWSTNRINEYEADIDKLRKELSNLSSRFTALELENRELHNELEAARSRTNELVELVATIRERGGRYGREEEA